MQDKYRQINKYIEILDGALKNLKSEKSLSIVDMGAGKGYLTFAMYDYLSNKLNINTHVYGVELRPQLVDDCNAIARQASFEQLKFIPGSIQEVQLPSFDVLVALHACDTATDDAIARGIKSNAKLIICSPCCHKQIRKELSTSKMATITKHGILMERQAEILTDAIRSKLLEAYGYKTNVFEFIATEHTPKNVIITAHKTKDTTTVDTNRIKEVEELKALWGIKEHYLETCLASIS